MQELFKMKKELEKIVAEFSRMLNQNYKTIEELNFYLKKRKGIKYKTEMIEFTKKILEQNIEIIESKVNVLNILADVRANLLCQSILSSKK